MADGQRESASDPATRRRLGADDGGAWRKLVFDPATGKRLTPEADQGAWNKSKLAPTSRWPSFFSEVVARLQWDAEAIDLRADARAWPELPEERRRRLTTLLCGFRVADDAVSTHLEPFGDVAENSLVMWVLYLQRRDETRHRRIFDRIAAEVVGLEGDTPEERLDAARKHAPPGILELFDERLPAMAAELSAGRAALEEGIGLYHMVLEGVVLSAGQRTLLDDLEDGVLPGVRLGVEKVELDERWHIGFGLRCLIDAQPAQDVLETMLTRAEEASWAWGDAVPAAIRENIAPMAARRLSVAKLITPRDRGDEPAAARDEDSVLMRQFTDASVQFGSDVDGESASDAAAENGDDRDGRQAGPFVEAGG